MARQRPTPRKRGSRRGRAPGKKAVETFYMQPGKRGTIVVLHRPVGNRASPKVCGVMPSRNHAKALVDQLQRAESAVQDLFYEATDDGIEALEAVLTATRNAILQRLPSDAGLGPDDMAAECERIQRELDVRSSQRPT